MTGCWQGTVHAIVNIATRDVFLNMVPSSNEFGRAGGRKGIQLYNFHPFKKQKKRSTITCYCNHLQEIKRNETCTLLADKEIKISYQWQALYRRSDMRKGKLLTAISMIFFFITLLHSTVPIIPSISPSVG